MVHAEATAKYVRTSAQKAGLVCDLIRGKDVNRALSTLMFARKSVAKDGQGAAVRRGQRPPEGRLRRRHRAPLRVGGFANQGPSQKRVRPAPMGRAFRVLKRTTHLTVEVTERPQRIKAVGEGEAKTPARRTRVKKAAAAE